MNYIDSGDVEEHIMFICKLMKVFVIKDGELTESSKCFAF